MLTYSNYSSPFYQLHHHTPHTSQTHKRDHIEVNANFFKSFSGEKVLCFHGPLIYAAKALKYQIMKDKQVKYFIHYAGWNKKYEVI